MPAKERNIAAVRSDQGSTTRISGTGALQDQNSKLARDVYHERLELRVKVVSGNFTSELNESKT